ncbi:NAD(P)H-dependent oxidoreductase [Archangium violaceum]|uniref:NAD(P)H-dependent oxidoreductase n=1 Tax=Archangium violaceum TaxID=83451 RepID=UPI001951ED31|nr:NAD(P)H-dependent oxidoreductase [Archangium violaceum]QRO00313.1 NAD(P)H-dependent oxidoreductase [Archangium violaceum]
MKVFIVHAHPEPQSFNGALTLHAQEVLRAAGHEVRVSDLHAMKWNPVLDRHNFTTVANPDYFKPQQEEMHAAQHHGFAPDVQAEMEKLQWCDVLVFQAPLWWFSLPAILKGWVDRVFAMGFAYGGGRWFDRGVFRGKRAMLSLTTGGGDSFYAPDGINGDINDLLYPINHGIFYFCGFDALPPFLSYAPARVSDTQRAAYLAAYGERLLTLDTVKPLSYPPLAAFDETFRRRAG